ncbi:ACF4 (YJR083C) [Zygosaccharomyces parabailii]|uniref:ZYBA0S06-04236g1_1 n=1 Tax=Zygosaccharomyces bailii (strain CLIB 213 / ATCC 58445 / CBS 680 / BCRC 21525 / NBRC 1098 / NCYC 1416 / NRRL Y-2227) TaxID=1333698 RepID=A0A8J2T7B4_ZYGB2|nr:ACF4 (YJR083C) [Zygosaccharomyces parabailii]CDF90251.1 ZYBA0S06-04236g1_1 [Zygosaccharomyces bailii CLIB 213]CDH11524.1 uncharacterized protein ZBAI_03310 [Zygosaccharomyces bailii ISA1307]SJM84605.1 uncharacterized protein ZBIST_1771 [Zygosaccharomyces bailii]
MSQPNTNQRVGLQKMSLVDKQSRSSIDGESASSDSARKQGLQLSIALDASPDRSSSGLNEQEMLYALAAKKRQIVELEHELRLARRDLKQLETQYRSVMEPPQSQLQSWHDKVQRTLENNRGQLTNPLSSLLGYGSEAGKRPPPPPPPRRDSGSTTKSVGGNASSSGGFLQSIVDKFQEFRVDEEEEEEFDKTQNKQMNDFYLKEKHDYDDEEEIEEEETGGTLLGGAAHYRR